MGRLLSRIDWCCCNWAHLHPAVNTSMNYMLMSPTQIMKKNSEQCIRILLMTQEQECNYVSCVISRIESRRIQFSLVSTSVWAFGNRKTRENNISDWSHWNLSAWYEWEWPESRHLMLSLEQLKTCYIFIQIKTMSTAIVTKTDAIEVCTCKRKSRWNPICWLLIDNYQEPTAVAAIGRICNLPLGATMCHK